MLRAQTDARADRNQPMGGRVGGGAGKKKRGSVQTRLSKSASSRLGSGTEEPGKVTRLIQPAHQWPQVGMVLVEFAGAGSSVCAAPAPEPEGSLNAQLSIAHAMFNVSNDTMRNHATIRTMIKGYYRTRSAC